MDPNEESVFTTTCHSHCGSACILKVHLRDGVITRIETDDGQEPLLRACARGRAYRQRVYAPDRLLYPLRRVGKRGSGDFQRISWGQALDTVASEIKRVKKAYGPSAVLFTASPGDIVWLHGPGLVERLLVRDGGYSGVWGTSSQEAQWFAAMATYGTAGAVTTRDNLLHSHMIIMWGWNPVDTRGYGNSCWYLAHAKEAGIKIVSVDPRHTDSAAVFADEWVPIKPNTDAAMLIGMAYTIIAENLQDQAFTVSNHLSR